MAMKIALIDDMLRCQTWGHQWSPHDGPLYLRHPTTGEWESLRCSRCTAERHSLVDPETGDVHSRRYKYPEGYKWAKDERPSRSQMRLELMRRWKQSERLRKQAISRAQAS